MSFGKFFCSFGGFFCSGRFRHLPWWHSKQTGLLLVRRLVPNFGNHEDRSWSTCRFQNKFSTITWYVTGPKRLDSFYPRSLTIPIISRSPVRSYDGRVLWFPSLVFSDILADQTGYKQSKRVRILRLIRSSAGVHPDNGYFHFTAESQAKRVTDVICGTGKSAKFRDK